MFFMPNVISQTNTAKLTYVFCDLLSCENTIFQSFIFGNIHRNALLTGEQHVNICFFKLDNENDKTFS